jgi:cell division protein FtsQ
LSWSWRSRSSARGVSLDYERFRELGPVVKLRRRRTVRLTTLGAALYLAVLWGLSWGCVSSYRWLLGAPAFALEEVEVKGLCRLSRDEVLRVGGVSEGANSLAVNLGHLAARLKRLPWVERVALERDLTGKTLAIDLREKRPVALIQLDNLYYVSQSAGLIKRLSPREGMDFPVVTGITPPLFVKYQGLLRGRVLPLIMAGAGGGGLGELSEVRVTADGGLLAYTLSGVEVRLGRNDCHRAFEAACKVLAHLSAENFPARPNYLDATHSGRVYVGFGARSDTERPLANNAPREG